MSDNSGNMLNSLKKIHFVGIGGSGMCPMAEVLHTKGFTITGSDIGESDTLQRVRDKGVKVTVGHKAENIEDPDLVVYTAAAHSDNPELTEAKQRGIPLMTRAEMLGLIVKLFETPICISGTHGKTTTTAMITQILLESGLDPSAIIGGKLPIIGSNSCVGKSGLLVCEACEYVDTFLELDPVLSVILNIDADHLDYFKTLENIIRSFHRFAEKTSQTIVVNGDSPNAMKSVEGISPEKIVTFGLCDTNDYYAADTNEEDTACEDFTLMYRGKPLGRVNLIVPGEHNMLNAVAAGAAAHLAGAAPDSICTSLGRFSGVHRRFEILGTFAGVTVADDFAHHPTELQAVLSSAMKMGYDNVWAIFQPHTYSRTYNHFDEFAEVLKIPDHLIMTEILAVRETNKYGIKTADLAEKISGSVWFPDNEEIADYVMERAGNHDLILTIGGGDVYKLANLIVERYQSKG